MQKKLIRLALLIALVAAVVVIVRKYPHLLPWAKKEALLDKNTVAEAFKEDLADNMY